MRVVVILAGSFGFLVANATAGAPVSSSIADEWSSQPPDGIPFKQSRELVGLAFTGRHARYANADTWYPSWAADGNMVSPWTDGEVNGVVSASYKGVDATTGYAIIAGDDPMNLTIRNVGTVPASAAPYEGRYPAGSLSSKGVWYYGTYCLDQTPEKHLNWDILGPFVGFRYSTDAGKSWHETRHTPGKPLFGEPDHIGGKVRMGAPHFVDFGRDMRYSPDGKAYLVAHGAEASGRQNRDPNLSWITGDEVYLARVTPRPANVDNVSRYEFFAGHDRHGKAVWTNDMARMKPLLRWDDHMGSVAVTYDAPLKKYLMTITDGGNTVSRFSTYILEARSLTGPWKLVTYMKDFGEQAYFVNIPSKFISRDGRTAWLSYSANFSNLFMGTHYATRPEGGGYWWTLQEVRLLAPHGQVHAGGRIRQ